MSKIIETLGVVVEDARFDFGEGGMEVRVVDPSHVAMIQMNIDAAAFDTWEIDENKLGLELRKIKELVSLGGATDMIEMAFNAESGVFTLNLGKIDRNIRPLDDSTMNVPTLPNLELPCTVKLSGADLAQALRAARQSYHNHMVHPRVFLSSSLPLRLIAQHCCSLLFTRWNRSSMPGTAKRLSRVLTGL
ncbi:hypothetical protein N9M40_04320 [Candidatus Poseidoniales archaeon]|nr:hypothetical protein [Candidatus Poseidoniales archaeon]